ncbi:MAG: hypothetical protein LBJ04_01160, partial [Sphingobacterium sp.]|nr:hypothetical protein [Sphingobacterium sp.]
HRNFKPNMIDPKVLKLERNYLTNCESKFKGTSNQDVPFFFCMFSTRVKHCPRPFPADKQLFIFF